MTATTNIQFGGLGLVSTTQKTLDRNTRYDHLFKKPDWNQRIVRRAGLVADVVADMTDVVFKYRNQTKEFAPYMRGISIYETCRNIWNFWYSRCKYKEDVKGLEQLRTADRSYWEGAGYEPGGDPDNFGIDCDDFSTAVSQTLLNLSIPCYLRIARYAGVNHFQHVYVVVPYGKTKIIIDCVLDRFDSEKPTVETKDFLIMDRYNFNGIDVAVLSGLGNSNTSLLDVVTGSDFFPLSGTGQANDKDKELAALHEHILKTRKLVAENPELVKEAEHPATFLKMLDYALQYWHTDKRDDALAILASRENEANELRGFSPGSDTSESEITMKALSGGGYEMLGKVGGQRKFFNKVKDAVKDVGSGVKKAALTAVKYNPLTVAARAGLLLAFKTNFLHLSDHLKWAYLPEAEAKKIGFDMEEYAKAKESLRHTEKMFVDVLQGKPENLRQTILTGRAGGLSGINLGELGIEPVTTTATTAAATGFIAQVKAWVKNVDLKKMLKKVDVSKLANKAKEAINKNGRDANSTTEESNNKSEGNGTDEKERKPEDEDQGGLSAALPLLVIGGLGLMMFAGSEKPKKQIAGFLGLGSAKKKHKPKQLKGISPKNYDIPALAGISHNTSPKSKKKKNKTKGVSKIKKLRLR